MVDPAVVALAGTALGATVAGVATAVNARSQNRREYLREQRTVRRESYSEFLHQAQSLWMVSRRAARLLRKSADRRHGVPVLSPTEVDGVREDLNGAFDSFSRTWQTVQLVAPAGVLKEASAESHALRDFNVAAINALDALGSDESAARWSEIFDELSRRSREAMGGRSLVLMQRDLLA